SGVNLGPRAAWISGGLLLLVVLCITIGYKGLRLTTFNPDYARALGISTLFWHFSFMSLISLTTVLSFESVGAILVVAFLIVPPATAYLLTHDLKRMLFLATGIGIANAGGGFFLAYTINGSIAGAMASVSGFLFILAYIYSQYRRKSK